MAEHITTPPGSAWAQVADQALQVDGNSKKMRRQYKVPTRLLRNIVIQLKVGSTIGLVHAYLNSVCDSVDQGITETEWALDGDDSWIVESYTVDQKEAGEYSVLKIVYYVNPFDIDDPDKEQTFTMDETVTQQMQSYSVSPYIYCNSDVQFTPTMLNAYNDNRTPVGLSSNRNHIESFLSQPISQKGGNLYGYQWEINKYAILTNAEAQIAEKVLNGANPVFHYPIVTYTKRVISNKSNPQATSLPSEIDHIATPSEDIFHGWEGDWVYTGRNGTRKKVNIYAEADPQSPVLSAYYELEWTDTWIGVLNADEDFYGQNAWAFGTGPTTEKHYD